MSSANTSGQGSHDDAHRPDWGALEPSRLAVRAGSSRARTESPVRCSRSRRKVPMPGGPPSSSAYRRSKEASMAFTGEEIAYLRSQPLTRLATVGPDGQPDVVPLAFEFDRHGFWVGAVGEAVAGTRKFRNVAAGDDRVALVSRPDLAGTRRRGPDRVVRSRTMTGLVARRAVCSGWIQRKRQPDRASCPRSVRKGARGRVIGVSRRPPC
jgi:PPOX class F420-dependent enzyme/OxyR family protein